jgi:cell division cycle 2-like
MAAKPSKWDHAGDDEETATIRAERKKEKEERRRLKEEKAQQAAAKATPPVPEQDCDERPHKRRRTSPDPDKTTDEPMESNKRPRTSPDSEIPIDRREDLDEFPMKQVGPCGHVNQFELLNKIEEGSYGLVSRAKRKASGALVALKKLKMDASAGGKFPITGFREIQTLKASRHVNVVNLQEVVTGDSLKE